MTKKQYLNDSYKTSFTAHVSDTRIVGEEIHVVLEETWFYPESGGQPADKGSIGDSSVSDVRLLDDEVIHVVDKKPPEQAPATIDANRRYDHMQQHSGQHLLSAAFIELFNAATVGFHLGDTASTIDITKTSLNPNEVDAIETLCQRWIIGSMPFTVSSVSRDDFDRMALRKKKLPDHVTGTIRLVSIGDVDVSHCGGTHLGSTAEIQTIKIIGTEKVRDSTRVTFLAGRRAIADYSFKHNLLNELSLHFTTGIEDLKQIILKQQQDNASFNARIQSLEKELSAFRAENEIQLAQHSGDYRILTKHYLDISTNDLRNLARELTAENNDLIFAGITVENAQATLICTAGKNYDGDLGIVIKEILPIFSGKGGGRGTFAQAVGEPGKEKEIIDKIKLIIT